MIVDRLTNAALYRGLTPDLSAAFAFLGQSETASLPDGRHVLDGDRLFALVQSYRTKPPEQGRWEAHRRYIDVQFVVSGTERIGVAPLESMVLIEPYDAAHDLAFYTGEGEYLALDAGSFAVLFPHEAHMPQLARGAPGAVRKIVVKVALA